MINYGDIGDDNNYFQTKVNKYYENLDYSVKNLNTLVSPVGKIGCVVLIDNFRGGEIHNTLDYPILLRQLLSVQYIHPQFREYLHRYWVSGNKQICNQTTASRDSLEYQPPNLFSFAAYSRPWKCQVIIQLFPGVEIVASTGMGFLQPPSVFRQLPVIPSFWKLLPSTIPMVKIVIAEESTVNRMSIDSKNANFLAYWMQLNNCQTTINANLLLLVGKVAPPASSKLPEVLIYNIELLKYSCLQPYGTFLEFIRPQGITIQSHDLQNLEHLSHLNSPGFTDPQAWVIGSSSDYELCHNLPPSGPKKLLSNFEKLSHAHTFIWLSIFSNSTIRYLSLPYPSCLEQNPEQPEYEPQSQLNIKLNTFLNRAPPMYLPIRTTDDMSSLKFVSCGKRGFHPLPIYELFNVFHNWVWLCLIIVAWALILTIKHLPSNLSRKYRPRHSYIYSVMKILLEQGDGYLSFSNGPSNFRIIAGIYILLAVVMSNAYKSNNVYNMISQKKPLPFYTIAELIPENFSIYTRVFRVNIHGGIGGIDPKKMELERSSHELKDDGGRHFRAFSEVEEWADKSNESIFLFMRKHSRIHPEFSSIVRRLLPALENDVHGFGRHRNNI